MPIVKVSRGELEVQAEMLAYLHQHVFDPILNSKTASNSAKGGARLTAYRLEEFKDKPDGASKIHHFFWSAVSGTEKSIRFFDLLKTEKLPSFEAEIGEFRRRWENDWNRRRKQM